VAGACAGYQLAANAAFVAAVPAGRRGQAFGLANGGMQVFQGLWFIVAGAVAGAIGPATMIAISGGIGAVVAALLAVSWRAHLGAGDDRRLPVRSIQSASGTPSLVRDWRGDCDQVHSERTTAVLSWVSAITDGRCNAGYSRLDSGIPGLSAFGVSPVPLDTNW
jgi:hypothetical protein